MAHFPVHDADRGDLCSICESKKQHLLCAVKSFWRRFLFSDHQPVCVWTGHLHETRDTNTDDEEPDGMLSTELDFVNPLMKLASTVQSRLCQTSVLIVPALTLAPRQFTGCMKCFARKKGMLVKKKMQSLLPRLRFHCIDSSSLNYMS